MLLLNFTPGRPLKKPKHNSTISEQPFTSSIQIQIPKIFVVVDSDSEGEWMNLEENIAQQDSPLDNIGSNDQTNDQSNSQAPSSSHNSVTSQMAQLNISFLCNPNDEEPVLHQPRVSKLFDKDLSAVQKRSWAKNSTCEQVYL